MEQLTCPKAPLAIRPLSFCLRPTYRSLIDRCVCTRLFELFGELFHFSIFGVVLQGRIEALALEAVEMLEVERSEDCSIRLNDVDLVKRNLSIVSRTSINDPY
jgi:hypothetical protein